MLPLAATSPGQISHPTLLYVLADVDRPAPALVPAAAVVGLASGDRLRVAREVLGARWSTIRGDAYGAAMNELEVMESEKEAMSEVEPAKPYPSRIPGNLI